RPDGCHRLLDTGFVPADQRQRQPLSGECIRGGPANPAGGAGEHTHLSAKVASLHPPNPTPLAASGRKLLVARGRRQAVQATAERCMSPLPCAESSAFSVTPRPPTSPTSACTPCSTAGRSRPASSAPTGGPSTSGGRWASSRTFLVPVTWKPWLDARPSATCAIRRPASAS